MSDFQLVQLGFEIKDLLLSKQKKIVVAESCTAGAVGAVLGRVPGISAVFCGSLVVYRETSKQEWLGIEAKTIKSAGVVSARIAREMVRAALTKTPEADFGVAITGNLFPTNSKETARLQGVCYIAFGGRNRASVSVKKVTLPKQKKERVKPSLLSQGISTKESSQAWVRTKCQLLASQALLRMVRSMLARQG